MADTQNHPDPQHLEARGMHSTHETELLARLHRGGDDGPDAHCHHIVLIAGFATDALLAAVKAQLPATCRCDRVASFREALDVLKVQMADAILVEASLSADSQHAELEVLRRKHPYPAMLLLAPASMEADCVALHCQVIDDYLLVDRDELPLLGRMLNNAAERRKLTRTLKQQHHFSSRLFRVVERTDNSVIITDLDGKVQWINEGFSRLSGFGMAEMIGRKPHRVLAGPGTDLAMLEQIDQAVATVSALRFEVQYYNRQGQPYWVNCDLEPLRHDDRVVGLMFMELDISQQKERERALRLSEERLQLALWGTEDGLYDWNLVNDSFFASTSWYTILGAEPPTGETLLRGEDIKNLIHPEDRPVTRQAYRDHLQGITGSFHMELRIRQKSGSFRWVLARGKVVSHDAAGHPLRMVGTIRDVHQQMLSRRELQEAKDTAEAASKVKTQFMTLLNHELRTPLNGIIGMNDLLLDTELSDEQQTFLENSQQSAHHLLHLISDLLDFSRLDAHHLKLNPAPFIVYDLVDDVIDTVKESALEKNLELVAFIDPGMPSCISGDYERIRQIITNLLRNAVKFTAKGHIILRLDSSRSDPTEPRMILRIAVEDTGCGVDAAEAETIFDFASADTRPSRPRHGGVGLGLSTVKLLTQAMHGSCRCSSAPSAGAVFSAEIQVEARPTDAITSGSQELRDQHVLLVNAGDLTRQSLTQMIRSLGGEPITTTTTNQALAILETPEQPVDVILLDNDIEDREAIYRAIDDHPGDAWITIIETIRQNCLATTSVPDGSSVCFLPARRRQLVQALQGLAPCILPTPKAEADPLSVRDIPKVLVVEDDDVNRDVCMTMLKKLGCQPEAATNGREAVHAVMRGAFDIVFMDIVMPVMDGIKAAAAICDLLPPNKRPTIIALSAAVNSTDYDLCLSAGMDDFLEKPLYKEDLANALTKWYQPFAARNEQ